MTDYNPGLWSDIGQAIVAAWPEVQEWSRVTDAEKFDWEQAVRDGSITFPYGLAVVGDMMEWEDGPADSDWFLGPVALFYIANDTGSDEAAVVEKSISAMQFELRNDTFSTMQVFPGFSHNVGPDIQTAIHELAQKLPATSGRIVFQCLLPGPDL